MAQAAAPSPKTHPTRSGGLWCALWSACLCCVLLLSHCQPTPPMPSEGTQETGTSETTILEGDGGSQEDGGQQDTPAIERPSSDNAPAERTPPEPRPADQPIQDGPAPTDQPAPRDDMTDQPTPTRCQAPPAAAWQAIQAATYKAGGFSIEVASNNVLQIFHTSAPKVALFAASRQSPVIAQEVDLQVEEHQGSFKIKDKVLATCRQARIDQIADNNGTIGLKGRFIDAAAACKGLEFTWLFCEERPGHLRFVLRSSRPSFNALSLRLASSASEQIYGMGVQFMHDSLNLKGKTIPALVQEGGVGRGHQPISAAVNAASSGSAGSETSTYYSMPHFMTGRWSSLLLENKELSIFDFAPEDRIDIRLFAPTMTGRILAATSPLEAIERLTEYTGRMPPLPSWVNQGAIIALARSLQESQKHIDALLAKGAKIAGVWNQTWPGKVKTFIGEQVLWNWAYNPHYHPDWSKYVAGLAQKNIKVLCYINPMFHDVPKDAGQVTRNIFKEGNDKGYFIKNAKGETYMIKVTAFEVGLLDLTNPAARAWMKAVIKDEMIKKAGCSGWMADFAEALPFDAVMHSTIPASAYHNQYPVDWIKLHREALQESGNLGKILVFNRSGFTQSSKYSMLLWQGDQLTTWDKYDGLVSALHGLISGGLSGVSLNHSDTGGYTSLSYLGLGYDREAEQLKRWTEMNAFTAVLRTHEGNQPGLNAQIYSDDKAMEHFARMTKVYQALAFYRTTLFQEAQSKGWPVVRHLMLHYPNDPGSRTISDQFLLGSQILVAPIKNKCWTKPLCPYNKEVYLPPGRWVHLWSGKLYGDKSQGTRVKVKAPIGEPAVFYPEGSTVGATFVQNMKKAGVSGLP